MTNKLSTRSSSFYVAMWISKILLAWVALGAAPALAACDLPVATFALRSSSMEPSLVLGDVAFATCFRHALPDSVVAPPVTLEALYPRLQRGDVVVLRYPHKPDVLYVSRLIGLPGEHVQLRAGELFINGQRCTRQLDGDYSADDEGSHIVLRRYQEKLPNGITHDILKERDDGFVNNTPEFVVPQNHVFVMGDNRDYSADSRFMDGIGFVPIKNLLGILYEKNTK